MDKNDMSIRVEIAGVTLELNISGNVLALDPAERRRACRLVDVFKEAARGAAKSRKARKVKTAGDPPNFRDPDPDGA